MAALRFVLGLSFLVAGADMLVKGASKLAAAVGISPLIIGLTLVAFGTSSPELAVSVMAAMHGQADIAVSNAIGSNKFNTLFILGVSALVAPLVVSRRFARLDVPIMIAVSILVLLISMDGNIGRLDGLLLLAGIVVYTLFLFRQTGQQAQADRSEAASRERLTGKSWAGKVSLIVGGLALLVLGSQWLTDGATRLALLLGVCEVVIGLTIVSAGTSLPEVAASIAASLHGERDIAVGNVVGSNIFNILAVLGGSALVAANGLAVSADTVSIKIPIMIASAIVCLPVFMK